MKTLNYLRAIPAGPLTRRAGRRPQLPSRPPAAPRRVEARDSTRRAQTASMRHMARSAEDAAKLVAMRLCARLERLSGTPTRATSPATGRPTGSKSTSP